MSAGEIKALDTLGAALALDDPKGDSHTGTPTRWKSAGDATQVPGEKLKKYLSAVH